MKDLLSAMRAILASIGARKQATRTNAPYSLMNSIEIRSIMKMGDHFIERLCHYGVSRDLDYLYVAYGTRTGKPDAIFEV
jgi:hypothetical protein